MTLDVSKPTDQALVSELPSYIRDIAIAVNAIVAGAGNIQTSEITIAGGTTALVIGTNLIAVGLEIVIITATGPATIDQIRGGTQGQIKVFIFQNNNITFNDGSKSLGELYLNQLPVGSDFVAQQDDVIALVNIDGNGGADYGYWKEIFRQVSVK